MDQSLDEIIAGTKPSADIPQSISHKNTPNGVSKKSGSRSSRRQRGQARSRNDQAKSAGKAAFIKNLSNEITEDDLRDLFRQVGPVVRVKIDRDNQDNRTGLAWVLFDYPADALVAAERFNQRRAAGNVTTVRRARHTGAKGNGGSSNAPIRDRIGARCKQPRKRNANKQAKPKPKTPADLDAELDAYMQVESGDAQPSTSVPESKVEDNMIDV